MVRAEGVCKIVFLSANGLKSCFSDAVRCKTILLAADRHKAGHHLAGRLFRGAVLVGKIVRLAADLGPPGHLCPPRFVRAGGVCKVKGGAADLAKACQSYADRQLGKTRIGEIIGAAPDGGPAGHHLSCLRGIIADIVLIHKVVHIERAASFYLDETGLYRAAVLGIKVILD